MKWNSKIQTGLKQCWIRIRRIRMFLGLLDPDPKVRGTDPDSSIIKLNSKKNLNPTVLWLLYDFLSLKNYVDVASKSNKQKILGKNFFFRCHLEGDCWKYQDPESHLDLRPDPFVRGTDDPHPDPYQNVTDSQHCGANKVSRQLCFHSYIRYSQASQLAACLCFY
jgi:hypothetical protein